MCTNYSLAQHYRSCEVDFSWTSKTKEEISASHSIQGLKWSKFKLGKFIPNIVSKTTSSLGRHVVEEILQCLGDSYCVRSYEDFTMLYHSTARFVPCGKCSECLNQRSKLYALRCLMEAREHKAVSYTHLTLPTIS